MAPRRFSHTIRPGAIREETNMKNHLVLAAVLFVALLGVGCQPIVVNSLEDIEDPPDGTVTLRSALASAFPGQPITFDASLDGGTIELTLVAWEHTILKGEVMGIRDEPSGPVSYLDGYYNRDY